MTLEQYQETLIQRETYKRILREDPLTDEEREMYWNLHEECEKAVFIYRWDNVDPDLN